MGILGFFVQVIVFADVEVALSDQFVSADAMQPEHTRAVIARLDDPSFQRREEACADLLGMGFDAIIPTEEAAESLSPEASVRAFDVLLRIYRRDDERTYEAAEKALRRLMRASNLAISARAERVFKSITEIRQARGVSKFKRLGGIIRVDDRYPERNYVLLGRDWKGGDKEARLIECIQEVHEGPTHLIIVRGTKISNEAILDLSIELPYLNIQSRGPARLGVQGTDREGCVIVGVEPGSAAERAGLTRGDRVLKIDGELIDDFKNLVEVIEKKEPGDRVPVMFFRGGEIHSVVAELLPWN